MTTVPVKVSQERLLSLNMLVILARLAVGIAFIASSLPKLRQPFLFLGTVYKYQLIGSDYGKVIAATLPVLELTIGCLLLSGVLVGGAFLCSSLLAALFTVVQASVLARGIEVGCGCFGVGSSNDLVSLGTVLRTALLLPIALVGWWAWMRARPAATGVL